MRGKEHKEEEKEGEEEKEEEEEEEKEGEEEKEEEEEEEVIDYVFKIVVVGDSAVGKTQLLGRFTKDEFHFDSKSTIGVEFQTRTLNLNRKRIKAQIWDTAGQERYRAITNAYYRGAVGAMLVYDVTRRHTFDHIAKWIEELRANADNSIVVVLIGNKSDLVGKREVSLDDAVEFAEEQGLFFSEASALSGENVETAFLMLLEEIYGVVSRQALECDAARRITYGGNSDVLNLRGTKLPVLSEASIMETSAMRKETQYCACSS
ncbi:ras-related protein RABA3-like [Zingiber officinale]|uniref:ras-related protein RABA3-like n=1 Tax=Zingiber officinale TaxID=94328 RepID=UPI001C4CFBBD|nr:ras-related protein RABA3-like [Zingiber officinale]